MASNKDLLLPELTSFIDGQREPLILTDLDCRILAANQSYRDAYSGSQSVVGRHCYEVSHHFSRPCDEAGETCPRRKALESNQPQVELHVHHTPRGEEHVEVQVTPIRSGRGQIRYFVERIQSLPTARRTGHSDGLIGRSPAFRQMLALIARVAPTDTSVLLTGETGVGKEMVTRLIHERSRRSASPLVVVDCSSLTETLFESELFGHEKGAFTGAVSRQTGLVESASGGTLFLDEVGDIPLPQQVKLLRLLESGTYRRVGGSSPLLSDFRLVAATHRDLEAMVREGSFRSDLYYRISAFPVRVPSLRERREDIAPLAQALLERLRPGQGYSLAADACESLERHVFPGNVRELRNIMERASLLAAGTTIRAADLPQSTTLPRAPTTFPATDQAQAMSNEDALRAALQRHAGDRRSLAIELGMSERTLYRRLREAGLSRRAGASSRK